MRLVIRRNTIGYEPGAFIVHALARIGITYTHADTKGRCSQYRTATPWYAKNMARGAL